MNVLHLFSNWKWTGPAEHALATASVLHKKGYNLTFACACPPRPSVEDSLEKRARASGTPSDNRFYLSKHFRFWRNAWDVVRLRHVIKNDNYDLIHAHLGNDHFIAALAAQSLAKKPALVRTVYDGTGLSLTRRDRLLFAYGTDGIITVSERARHTIEKRFGFPPDKLWKICPGVDCEKFNHRIDGSAVRVRYGVGPDNPLVGIVARVQTHRRFDVFISAIERVVREIPQLKVFIIGRGTHIQEVAMQPVKERGLTDTIFFTGYHLQGYPEVLAALDIKVFLVPGSDGSCRAVREVMAMGKPVIVANRGMLAEIVEDGVSGLVVDDSPVHLARAITTLLNDVQLRKKMGEAARKRMCEDYNLATQVEKVEAVYKTICSH